MPNSSPMKLTCAAVSRCAIHLTRPFRVFARKLVAPTAQPRSRGGSKATDGDFYGTTGAGRTNGGNGTVFKHNCALSRVSASGRSSHACRGVVSTVRVQRTRDSDAAGFYEALIGRSTIKSTCRRTARRPRSDNPFPPESAPLPKRTRYPRPCTQPAAQSKD
jgi:hypothetical protein